MAEKAQLIQNIVPDARRRQLRFSCCGFLRHYCHYTRNRKIVKVFWAMYTGKLL